MACVNGLLLLLQKKKFAYNLYISVELEIDVIHDKAMGCISLR